MLSSFVKHDNIVHAYNKILNARSRLLVFWFEIFIFFFILIHKMRLIAYVCCDVHCIVPCHNINEI
jgi:hypothetical protein